MFGFGKREAVLETSDLDAGALRLISLLAEHGFEAYLVGGCVRDLLMGLAPHDWDITTSAKLSDVIGILTEAGIRAVDGGGRRFGTVIAVVGGENYEITTYRREFYGMDAHRPERVAFAKTLAEDLSRRDFTVNAMAVGKDGRVADPFGGLSDLKRRRLRTVGDSKARFSEDALRLFRACRFVAQLDFLADSSLVSGMESAFSRVAGLSLSRVKTEILKTVTAPHAGRGLDLLVRTGLSDLSCRVRENGTDISIPILPELSHLVDLPQMKQFHKYDAWYHTLAVVEAAPQTEIDRLAALFHDIGKGMPGVRRVEDEKITDHGHDRVGAEMTKEILTRLRFPQDEVRLISFLVRDHMKFHYFVNNEKADVKKWVRHLAQSGMFRTRAELTEAIFHMTALAAADVVGCGRPYSATDGHFAFGACMKDLAEGMPVSTKELCYDSRVIEALSGKMAGGMANLLSRVQAGTLPNTPDDLAAAAVRYGRRHE